MTVESSGTEEAGARGPSPAVPPPKAARSVLSVALLLLPLQIAFRSGEALLPLLLSAWFGHSAATDAQVAFAKLFAFTGGALVASFQDSAYVPVLSGLIHQSEARAAGFVSALWGRTLILTGGLSVLLASVLALVLRSTSHESAPLGLLGFGYVAYLCVQSTRALLVGTLNTRKKYAAYPIASGAGISLALALIYLLRNRLGVASIPWGLAAGELLSVAVLYTYLNRASGVRLAPNLRLDPEIANFVKLVGHEVFGATLTRINPFVDQLVARAAGQAGGGTLLNYAFDVASLPTSLAQAALFPPLLSELSEAASQKDWPRFKRTLVKSLSWLSVALLGLALVFHLARRPLVYALFRHGSMDAAGCDTIADILPYALVGAVPFGALLIFARAHVALKNTRIMIPLGVLNAGLNALFNILLFKWIGLRGIALSTSLMQLSIAVVFYMLLPRALNRAVRATENKLAVTPDA